MSAHSHAPSTSFPVYAPLLAVFVVILGTLNHVLMSWIWVLSACAVVIALLRVTKKLPGIKNITLNLLAIFCMLLLVYLASDFGLMATMVNLLVVAGCLKLINMQSSNDYYVMLSIQVLLIACGLVYHQSLMYSVCYFLIIVMLLVSAFIVNRGSLALIACYKQSIKMIIQTVPIAIALFVVAPRLPPFWQTVVDKSAQTGLSETLSPGDIANLAKTDDLVFRAEFSGSVPPPQQRYWRSIILDYFDGKTWSINSEGTNNISPEMKPLSGDSYQYLVMAEPNHTKWLYSLDTPVLQDTISGAPLQINWQYQLFKPDISTQPSLYIVRSYYNALLDQFDGANDSEKYLQVPEDSNPKTRKWLSQNISHSMSFSTKLETLNSYFTTQNFRYTLRPPLMPSNAIDAFLFDYQQGFCSHYASALTYMLRLANIPARMVAGYQGGELESEKILSVRQYDAHAWVEAYHPEKGWLRLDPTALIAPNRALSGLMSSLSAHESEYFNQQEKGIFHSQLFDEIRQTLAIIDFNWNTLVLGFSQDSQVSLIEKIFGELNQKTITTFLILSIVCISLFLAVVFLPYKKWFSFNRPNALQNVLRKLQQMGFVRKTQEPLQVFYSRIEPQLSAELRHMLTQFIALYYEVHYKHATSLNSEHTQNTQQKQAALHVFARKIRKLKLNKPSSKT